jgi:HNH endonuclease
MREKRTARNFGKVYRVRGAACLYCGGVADSVDHVLPWSYCPDNSTNNLVPACMECNGIASNLIFSTLDEKVRYVVGQRQRRGLPVYLNYYEDELEDDRSRPEPEPVMYAPTLHPSGISDEEFISAYGDGVVSAVWEVLNEPEPDAELEDYTDNEEDAYLCGAPTRKGRPCRIPKDECQIHNANLASQSSRFCDPTDEDI